MYKMNQNAKRMHCAKRNKMAPRVKGNNLQNGMKNDYFQETIRIFVKAENDQSHA